MNTLQPRPASAAALLTGLWLAACAHEPAPQPPPPSTEAAAVQPVAPDQPADDGAGTVAPADTAAPAASQAAPASLPSAFVCQPYDAWLREKRKPAVHKEVPHAPAQLPVVQATQPAPAESAEPAPGGPMVVSVLGKKVFARDGSEVGRVVDLLADRSGRMRAAVIDFGGFMGVGNRRIAVDWHALKIDPGSTDKPVILAMSREQVESAPEFHESDHPERAIFTDPAAANAPASAQ